jgi:hypothetical protein
MVEVLKLVYEAVRLRKLVRKIVQDSIPSVAAHGALTIAPKTWAEMFETVAPELALYNASLRSAAENLLPSDLEVAKVIAQPVLSEDAALVAAEAEIEQAETVMLRMEMLARQRGWSEKWGTPFWEFLEDVCGVG